MTQASPKARRQRAAFLYVVIFVLCVLHQDFWWWEEAEPLVFGFLPIGLAWQLGISLGATLAWLAMVCFAWPAQLDDFDASEARAARGLGVHTDGQP